MPLTVSCVLVEIILCNIAVVICLEPCTATVPSESKQRCRLDLHLRIANDLSSFRPTGKNHIRIGCSVDLLVRAQIVRASLAFCADGDFVRDVCDHELCKQQSEHGKLTHGANSHEALRRRCSEFAMLLNNPVVYHLLYHEVPEDTFPDGDTDALLEDN
jgi:hypothetical protein